MVSAITSSVTSYFPAMRLAPARQMLKNVTKIALPVIALLSSSYLFRGVEGGPVAYGVCMGACLAATSGAFPPACHAACLVLLGTPAP